MTDLHVLWHPRHDFTTFVKMPVSMGQIYFGDSDSKTYDTILFSRYLLKEIEDISEDTFFFFLLCPNSSLGGSAIFYFFK